MIHDAKQPASTKHRIIEVLMRAGMVIIICGIYAALYIIPLVLAIRSNTAGGYASMVLCWLITTLALAAAGDG